MPKPPDSTDRRRRTRNAALTLLWLWVVGAFATYLFQFRNLVEPILATLGLAGN